MNRNVFAVLVAATACAAHAGTERTALAAFDADQLKSAYLDCERAAASGLVGSGDAAPCSIVHEVLKERVFGGDFGRMLAWWRTQQAAQRTQSTARTAR
jgi:hypothetical protein